MNTWHVALDCTKPTHKVGLRLSGFVLASMVLHLALLLSQHAPPEFGSTHVTTMQVTTNSVIATPVPTTSKSTTSSPLKDHKPRTAPAPQRITKTAALTLTDVTPDSATIDTENSSSSIEQAAHNSITPSVSTTSITSANRETASEIQLRATITQRLKQALAKHFYYPMMARKHGWQGQVLLAFNLDTRGTIINARVAQSSGYHTLDQAALKSINKVTTLDVGLSQPLSFELPVIYNLNGG
jgi:protein TonB